MAGLFTLLLQADFFACTSARRCFLGMPLSCLVLMVPGPVCIIGRVRMGAGGSGGCCGATSLPSASLCT